MRLTSKQKEKYKQDLVNCLSSEKEIQKIIIFGSFVNSDNPNDIDIAVFQNSSEPYLSLAMKYRKKTRPVANRIPLDIFPIKSKVKNNSFLTEIVAGEIIYER